MAISINWETQVITVPKADTQLVSIGPPEIRQLDIDNFRKDLNALQAAAEGMPFLTTHTHFAPVTVGGVTLARVFEIINGYTVTFEDGAYAVNLVGANSNIGDVVNLNQVSIRSSNSAGLTFSEQINSQSFTDNKVYIDVNNGLPGSQFPRGTPTDPVDNFVDADIIATTRNLSKYDLTGSLTIPGGYTLQNKEVDGSSLINSILTLNGQSTQNATFRNLRVIGAMQGDASFFSCALEMITFFIGTARDCSLNDTLVLDTFSTDKILLKDCTSNVAGLGRPVFNFNGAGAKVSIRAYTGGITISNMTHADATLSIDFISGTVELDASCTDGEVVIGGDAYLINNSTIPTVNVDRTVTALTAMDNWTTTERSQIRDALGLAGTKVTATGGQLQSVADDVWLKELETNYTAQELMRLITSIELGKTTINDLGGGLATITFRDINDLKDRVIANMTGSERTSLSYDDT